MLARISEVTGISPIALCRCKLFQEYGTLVVDIGHIILGIDLPERRLSCLPSDAVTNHYLDNRRLAVVLVKS
jgi:hypothetical protein